MLKELKVEQYVRKPFPADVVKVTSGNLELAAEWCGGDVRVDPEGKSYVKVRVHRPQGERHSMAYPGDRILYASSGYKVYTARAFEASFELADGTQPSAAPKPPQKKAFPKKPSGRPVPRPPRQPNKNSQSSHQ